MRAAHRARALGRASRQRGQVNHQPVEAEAAVAALHLTVVAVAAAAAEEEEPRRPKEEVVEVAAEVGHRKALEAEAAEGHPTEELDGSVGAEALQLGVLAGEEVPEVLLLDVAEGARVGQESGQRFAEEMGAVQLPAAVEAPGGWAEALQLGVLAGERGSAGALEGLGAQLKAEEASQVRSPAG